MRPCIALLILLLVNCSVVDWLGGKRPKQQYCEQHPETDECHQEYPDADTKCRSNTSCMTPTSVCDLTGSMMCVQCVAPDQTSACPGTTPACDVDHTCVQCVAPDQLSACTGPTPACATDHTCVQCVAPDQTSACTGSTPVCGPSHTCVQCIAPDQTASCTGIAPLCGADQTCHPCTKHQDCSMSNACLPDGSCAQADQVAYVDPMLGSGNTCSKASPCKKVDDALKTSRPIVKLTGMIDEAVRINNQAVTLLAEPGTQLTRTGPGAILTIDGSSVVQVVDLAIVNGSTITGVGISLPLGNTCALSLLRATVAGNTGGGISATGGSLTISRSTITGNTQHGISVSGGQFDISNCLIAGNGGPLTSLGGVRFDQTSSGTRRFDFNTVTNNASADGNVVGVLCTAVAQSITFSNNIIYANQIGGTRTQVGGTNCNWRFSDIGDAVAGTGNLNVDPLFVDSPRSNFHLQSGSPVKDKADSSSTVNVDIDGDTRPQGAGFDMGADEIK